MDGLDSSIAWNSGKSLAAELRPGLLVFLERINFHPPFEDGDAVDGVAGVDQFLRSVNEARLTVAAS